MANLVSNAAEASAVSSLASAFAAVSLAVPFVAGHPPARRARRRVKPLPLAAALSVGALALASPSTRAADATPAPSAVPEAVLPATFVTGNPLGRAAAELTVPVTELDGKSLALRRAGTLGETLDGLPGISATSYGPNVSRPIIRGLDGDRIRVLQNGTASLDASSLSYDHAVAQDPLSIERVEIVRGPAALLYGGNAVGGVVNTIDNRIPRESLTGISGATDFSYGGANRERAGAAQLEFGNGQFAFHVDGFARKSADLRIPGFAHSTQRRALDGEEAPQASGTLPNSDGQVSGAAAGASWTWADGYAGLSYSGYDSDYGTVAEEDTRIRLRQQRVALASEVRNLSGPFTAFKFDFGYTDYEHKEIENGETGTTFKNHGYEGRIEARHAKIGPVEGAVGVQFSQNTFSALGEEAFVPKSDTNTVALFALEEWAVDPAVKLSFGARVEHSSVKPTAGGNARFDNLPSRNFTPGSVSAGAVFGLASAWSLAVNTSYTERAPTFYELYANGPHLATGVWEIGSPQASLEKAVSTDVSLRYANGPNKGSVGVFYSRFSNFIALNNTGRTQALDDDTIPVYQYAGVPADLYGVEAEGRARVWQGHGNLDVELRGDYTVGRNRDTGEPLPRIAPLRLTGAIVYGLGRWGARLEVVHASAQGRVPANDLTTSGYTTLGASLTYQFKAGGAQWLAYLKGENLTNQEVRLASSVLRDIAPQGGRAVRVGLRTTF
ncbi:TonB-dependent receptor [Pandoraea pnomenusa]|jgi:iron complex outermembrane receptor protein|uniref:TonB-dependent receptor n=1 Tax=Pandoraea pnomenusa TaxID=93220 RepID=A0ABY6WEP1_9BURK|nr:TonB-dependent receptor [Pandoraea pnomenusa]QDH58007.1 TonB-dependent receptor [Pandoraea pnomenusa]VVE61660.1 putative TonB-dependent receptor [Pandoraea pnomenusa]